MKKQLIYIWSGLLLAAGACEPQIDVPEVQAGSADFSRYVAVGNSLTAGFSNSSFPIGLYPEAQQASFPNLLAMQMQQITPSEFLQPEVTGNGSGYLYLEELNLSTVPPTPTIGVVPPDPSFFNKIPGNYNNLGIPLIRVRDVTTAGYGASPTVGNPFFYRILPESSPNKTYLEVVQESNPTFFTCWLGNNDVLGFATSGGAAGMDALTDLSIFEANYTAIVEALEENGTAEGVLATIPDVSLTPYFTQVPWNGLGLTADQAAQANGLYAAQIDPQVKAAVQQNVIQLAVTEQALKDNVTGQVAEASLPNGTQQEIDARKAALDAELQNHLLGIHDNHAALEPLYLQIDNILATSEQLQAGINQGIDQLTAAYNVCETSPGNCPIPAQYAQLNDAITTNTASQISTLKAAGIYPVFNAGPNAFVIEVPVSAGNPLGLRQMKSGELILLTALSGGQLTPQTAAQPKANQYILTEEELALVRKYTEDYNNIIRNLAAEHTLALFETSPAFSDIIDGIFTNGVGVNAGFITGGFFSLDGVHPTPRGYAVVANYMISTINDYYDATIPPVNISDYAGVPLP
jgi:phospholipase/lecithinase/hemolysin